MSKRIKIEVCCGSVDDAIASQAGGANRIELNSALFLGGLTPSSGSIIETKRRLSIPIMVMIRPRSGGFCYTDNEMHVMMRDTEAALAHGAEGIVFGILTPEGDIDIKRSKQIINLTENKDVVFHRAFDVVRNPKKALEELIDLGVNRILTSGQKPTALQGTSLIKKLIDQAEDRIEILPGGGIRSHNINEIIKQTSANQFHISAFKHYYDTSMQNNPDIIFGGTPGPPEDRYSVIDSDIIRSFFDSIDM